MVDASRSWTSAGGTRFRLFAQPSILRSFREPETVCVSSPARSVGAGPADERMYVIDPIGKRRPYGPEEGPRGRAVYLMPPWRGPTFPPALPDIAGHFDYLPVHAPEFEAAHLFGAVRLTLDVWERYFGHEIVWHFAKDFQRLELVIQRNLHENAFMGYGFLEVGIHRTDADDIAPFSLNFDVIAHEVGHCIVYAVMGAPDPGRDDAEYYGFHESAADLTALVAALHFESVIDDLLSTTRGNLYTLNLVNRIAELSDNDQIRLAANDATLADFVQGWHDEHDLAQPLTGAVFDILVDIFHEELVDRGLIHAHIEDLSDQMEGRPDYHAVIQPLFDAAYAKAPEAFRGALKDARDTLGMLLAETWQQLSPSGLGYDDVGRTLLEADLIVTGGRLERIIRVNFRRRAIGLVRVGPRLGGETRSGHFNAARVFVPPGKPVRCGRRLTYRERYESAARPP